MVYDSRRQRLNLPIAPLVAALIGGVTALVFTLMPVAMLEDFVIDSGVAAVLPAAEPPLGDTARAALIMIGGGGAALIAWFALFLILGARTIVIQRSGESDEEKTPVLRRADAHPDAPARRPLFANRDLGTPFLEVRAQRPIHITAEMSAEAEFEVEPVEAAVEEREIPADLDVPLAAYDPQAIPAAPVDWFASREPREQASKPFEPREQASKPFEPREQASKPFEPLRVPFEPARMPFEPREQARTPFEPREQPRTPFEPREPREPSAPFKPFEVRESGAPLLRTPRQQVFDPGERFETFDLTPMRRQSVPAPVHQPLPIASPASPPSPVSPLPMSSPTPISDSPRSRASARVELDPSASIHALLDRLERGVGRREILPPPPPAREENLEDTLVALRRLATAAR